MYKINLQPLPFVPFHYLLSYNLAAIKEHADDYYKITKILLKIPASESDDSDVCLKLWKGKHFVI